MDASGVQSLPWEALKAAGVRLCRATAEEAKRVADDLRGLDRAFAKAFDLKGSDAVLTAYSGAVEAWSVWDLRTEDLLGIVGVGGELHLGDSVVPMAWFVGTPALDAAVLRSPRATLAAFKAVLQTLTVRYGCVGNIMPNKSLFNRAARLLTHCGAHWHKLDKICVWLSNPGGIA